MKIKNNLLYATLVASSFAAALLTTNTAHADSATWTGAAADGNLWSTVGNWAGPPASVPGAGQVATFNSGSAGGVIDLGAGVTISQLSFQANAPSLTIGAGGVNNQTLALTGGDGMTGGGSSAGTTLNIDASVTVTGATPRFLFFSQPTVNINGNLTTAAASGTTMLRLNDSGISLNGVVSNGTNALMGLQLQQNTYNVTNANNSFTGGILMDNASVNFATLSTTGNNSALGAGGTIGLGNGFGYGVLNYTGTGGSVGTTDRAITLNHGAQGGTLRQSGTGLLEFTGNVTGAGVAGSPTLRLQGDTLGTGEMSGSIQDNATIGSTTTGPTVPTGSSTITLFSVAGIEVGASVTGSARLQAGTTVTAIDAVTKTITLSLPTTGGNLNQNSTISVTGVTNPTGVAKSGTGTWVLSGDNTYTGSTTVGGGLLEINGSGRLGGGNYAAAISIANTSSGTLKFNTTADQVLGGVISGTGALVKDNTGTLTLTNASSTLSGATLVSAGTLLVNGALGTSAVTVDGGAFGGTGSIGATLDLVNGSFHVVDLLDALQVAGTVSLYAGFGVDDLTGLDWSTVSAGTYTLIEGTLGAGVFAGLANNSLGTAYNAGFDRIAYFQEGSLQLVVDIIPEPSTALLGALGMLALRRRRRA